MKKIIVLLLLLLPMGAFSQEVKWAFVDFNAVFDVIPEREEAELKFAAVQAQYQEQYNQLQTEFTAKYEEYMKLIEGDLAENLKVRRQQELEQLNDRLQNFIPQAQQDLEQENSKLMAPVQEKILNAIKAVGQEQGYTIFTSQAFFHTGSLVDATPLVKAKLGIK